MPCGLDVGALDHGRGLGIGLGGLGLIFGLERLGLGAELGGLVELGADAGDLLVERGADQRRHALPDQDGEHRHHRQRDPGGRVEAERGRLGVMLGRGGVAGGR